MTANLAENPLRTMLLHQGNALNYLSSCTWDICSLEGTSEMLNWSFLAETKTWTKTTTWMTFTREFCA
jgi:hypothetical protein